MTHIYRDADVYGSRDSFHRWLSFGLIGLFGCVLLCIPAIFGWHITWSEGGMFGGFIGFALAVTYRDHRHAHYGTCGEIRLDDGGVCELETKRRVVRLNVREIRSVKYRCDESGSEHYTIYYQGGNLRVTKRMTDWLDFLTRLATFNPTVDLTTMPAVVADALPNRGGSAIEERTLLHRFATVALFPLIVIAALVWLAIQSTTGH